MAVLCRFYCIHIKKQMETDYDMTSMVNVLIFQTLFFFCPKIKCGLPKAGIHKMLARIANSEDPDQTASSEAV